MAEPLMQIAIAPPDDGVELTGGVLAEAHANNIAYLKSLSMDSILYWFRVKAGLPAPGEPYRGHFEDNIKGQTAALFLMGVLAASLVHTISPSSYRRPLVQLISGGEGSQSVVRRFSEIDRKYQRVKDSFLATIEAHSDVMDPRFVKMVENRLQTIDQAVTELMMHRSTRKANALRAIRGE